MIKGKPGKIAGKEHVLLKHTMSYQSKNYPGIYVIQNDAGTLQYVGQTLNLQKRYAYHSMSLESPYLSSGTVAKLYYAYKEASDTFSFRVLEVVENITLLDEKEQYYISILAPALNTRPGGS